MKTFVTLLVVVLAFTARATIFSWTNTLGGSWYSVTNWSPNGVPGMFDTAWITNAGSYSVFITNTAGVTVANLQVGGPSGTQTLIEGSAGGSGGVLNVTTTGTIAANGVLNVTNAGLQGIVTVQTGGQLQFSSGSSLFLYSLTLTNQGTVAWGSGSLNMGNTVISNGGLWQMTGDATINYGGGNVPIWVNSGILRKSPGASISSISSVSFTNLPGGLVDVQTGTLDLFSSGALGGTLSATGAAQLNIASGTWTDAGGVAVGTGTVQFMSGTFNLRTNPIPGLKLTGGDIYITGTNTFQQTGAITNLTLDGATLHGTNRIAGTLTLNLGFVQDQLTVLPSGQLLLATPGTKYLYSLDLINQGVVTWADGPIGFGSTVVSNGGLWQINSDNAINYGGGAMLAWTNSGILRKTAGSAFTTLSGFTFINETGGLVQVDSGTLQLPSNTTNSAGTLRVNGGALQAAVSTLAFTGGTLDGSGSFGPISITGGTVTPGQGGPGSLAFSSGLNLGSGATLMIDGAGLVPGTQYDQLSATGGVSLGGCNLQVTSLPQVAPGTTFVIITNLSGGAVSGTFNGLPENALLTVSGQPFRVHYASGAGHHVTLVRDAANGPQLTAGAFGSGNFTLNGSGKAATIYAIQATTNFLQWSNIGSATGDGVGHFAFTDTNAANFRYRFYRTTN